MNTIAQLNAILPVDHAVCDVLYTEQDAAHFFQDWNTHIEACHILWPEAIAANVEHLFGRYPDYGVDALLTAVEVSFISTWGQHAFDLLNSPF